MEETDFDNVVKLLEKWYESKVDLVRGTEMEKTDFDKAMELLGKWHKLSLSMADRRKRTGEHDLELYYKGRAEAFAYARELFGELIAKNCTWKALIA